jgi:hypothetical protein
VAFTEEGNEMGMAHANIGGDGKVAGRKFWPGITCFNCQGEGHYSNECTLPDKRETRTPGQNAGQTGMQMLMAGVEYFYHDKPNICFVNHHQSFHQKDKNEVKLPKNWILLDNQSTVNVFSHGDLLRNIKKTDRSMTIMCNVGVTKTNMIGEFPGYPGEVWYNPDGIAKILSLSERSTTE